MISQTELLFHDYKIVAEKQPEHLKRTMLALLAKATAERGEPDIAYKQFRRAAEVRGYGCLTDLIEQHDLMKLTARAELEPALERAENLAFEESARVARDLLIAIPPDGVDRVVNARKKIFAAILALKTSKPVAAGEAAEVWKRRFDDVHNALGCDDATVTEVIERAKRLHENADKSFCVYCGELGPKDPKYMVEHMEKCEKHPVGKMFRGELLGSWVLPNIIVLNLDYENKICVTVEADRGSGKAVFASIELNPGEESVISNEEHQVKVGMGEVLRIAASGKFMCEFKPAGARPPQLPQTGECPKCGGDHAYVQCPDFGDVVRKAETPK